METATDDVEARPGPGARPASSRSIPNELLNDVSGDVRARAVSALAVLEARAPGAVAVLTEIVRHPETRLSTIWMLAGLTGSAQDAIPVLAEILRQDTDVRLRRAVLDAIGRLAEPAK